MVFQMAIADEPVPPSSTESRKESDLSVNNLVNLTLISNDNRSVNIGEERGHRSFEQTNTSL
jgi:hypothetical protein